MATTVTAEFENPPLTVTELAVAIIFCGCSAFLWHALYFLADCTLWPSNDLPIYYAWAVQFIEGLHDGYLYPRWMHLANSGLGEPAFLYYSPLYFYLVAGVNYIANDIWFSMKFVALLINWIGGIVGYLFYRKMGGGSRFSLLGVFALQGSPMLIYLLMMNNSLPWYSSWPAILSMLYFYRRSDNYLLNIPLSVAFAIVVYSHILSAFMVLLCLPFISVGFYYTTEKNIPVFSQSVLKNFLQWILSAIFGLGLSAIYLVPAMFTQNFINPNAWFFNWRNGFVCPIFTAIIHGMHWRMLQWGIGGIISITTIAACMYLYYFRSQNTQIGLVISGLTCISITAFFFSSELSYPLWSISDFLSNVQRPFRFLYISGLVIPIIITLILSTSWHNFAVWKWITLILLILCISVSIFIQIKVVRESKKAKIDISLLDRNFGEEEYYISEIGATWRDYIKNGGFTKECETAEVSCTELLKKTQKRMWRIETDKPNATIRLPLFAFPAWQVRIDGKVFPRMVDKDTGLITVQLGSGCHIVEVEWVALAVEKIGAFISISFLLAILIIQMFKYKKSLK